MSECTAHQADNEVCANGFKQIPFCIGKGVGANLSEGTFYRLRKEAYPQCLWDDGVHIHSDELKTKECE